MLLAASLYEVILAVHIMAVVVAFGVTFAYPIMFAVGARYDPRALPVLHRIEYTIERTLINGGLLVVVAAGVYLASDAHLWSQFFVQWGLGTALVIGGLVGGVMIPTAKRAEAIATRDVAAASAPRGPGTGDADAGGAGAAGAGTASAGTAGAGAANAGAASAGSAIRMSDEYRALVRRLSTVGALLSVLVLVTILFMAIQP